MSQAAQRLEDTVQGLRAMRESLAAPGGEPRWLKPLQRWQSHRLAETFADLLISPRTAAAAQFFLAEMYGDEDVSWRDRDVLRMLPTMRRWLPDAVLDTVNGALELDRLSLDLDLAMAEALRAQIPKPTSTLRVRDYARAYAEVGRARDRERQLDLLASVGKELDRVVRMPLVYTVLRLARGPAGKAGLGQLQAFLERGMSAFRALGGAGDFLRTIDTRERAALRALARGEPAPFGPDFPTFFPC